MNAFAKLLNALSGRPDNALGQTPQGQTPAKDPSQFYPMYRNYEQFEIKRGSKPMPFEQWVRVAGLVK